MTNANNVLNMSTVVVDNTTKKNTQEMNKAIKSHYEMELRKGSFFNAIKHLAVTATKATVVTGDVSQKLVVEGAREGVIIAAVQTSYALNKLKSEQQTIVDYRELRKENPELKLSDVRKEAQAKKLAAFLAL
jgi:hypothetical protein